MSITVTQAIEIVQRRGDESADYATTYGEPGYSDPEAGILFANWNNVPKYIQNGLTRRGFKLEWSDEWKNQIVYGRWIMVDGPCGIDAIPFDVVFSNTSKKTLHPTFNDVREYTENKEAWSIEIRDGYGARLSAPGYMDCTSWTVYDTEDAAKVALEEMYGEED